MTNYNDGMIHGWNGGVCPVHPDSRIQFWLRHGAWDYADAVELRWDHCASDDIIAFRVTKAHTEPKTIWAVYYMPTGCMLDCFSNEADAFRCAGHNPEERKVIEFKEVTE